jgi:hypothetical protein
MSAAEVERRIMKRTIKELFASGYQLGVNDGEEVTIRHSTDARAVLAALRTTDDDYLLVYRGDGAQVGWVRFVYGNSGPDVIADYTTNLETVMRPVEAYADRFEGDA